MPPHSLLLHYDCLTPRVRLVVPQVTEQVAEQESSEECADDRTSKSAGGVLTTAICGLPVASADCLNGLSGYEDGRGGGAEGAGGSLHRY